MLNSNEKVQLRFILQNSYHALTSERRFIEIKWAINSLSKLTLINLEELKSEKPI